MRADVAEPLNGDPRPGRLAPQPAEQLERQQTNAAAGRFFAAGNPVVLDRLAGHDARIEAVVLVVLVHDPGHHAMIGAHVGRRDILIRPDQLVNLVDELARDSLQLALR